MSKVLFVMRDDGDMTEPMNIMLLSALAKARGWQTDITVLERDDIGEVVKAKKPDVVAFSAITGSHQALLDANDTVKKTAPSVKTVIGGPYATFCPQTVNERPFDALGVGECDDAWPELLDAWEAGRSTDAIANIITPDNSSRVLKRTLVGEKNWMIMPDHLRGRKTNLDDLPFMDRGLIYENTAFKNRYKRTMMAGRGCPYRCTYCFEHAWNEMYTGKGKVLQRHSVKRLCAELRELSARWDTRFVKFYDDVFPVFDNTDDAWLEEFAEVYPREVGLPFHCLVRAEQVNERKLKLLKRAGIASITMSIESGNAFVRDYVLIRDMRDEDLRNSFAICRRLRIHTFANTILAVPSPTLPDVDATKDVYDAELAKILTIATEVDPKRPKTTKKFADKVKDAQASASDEWTARLAVDEVLRDAGVRKTNIDYDKESVWYNVELGVSFGELPVFFPYSGTQLGKYAVRHGAFDGDYSKLHASYQTRSPLNFTEYEKLQQQNLALLGTIVLELAGSYNPVLNALAKPATWLATEVLADLPLTSLYERVYSFAKNDMHARRIYPMKFTPKERFDYFWENYVLDAFKQFGAKKGKRFGIFRHRGDRPGQTLGGPPSV